jgi:cytochrome b
MEASVDEIAAGGGELPASVDRAGNTHTVRVWDPVVRVFHWSLVIAFVLAWATAEEAQNLHETIGYVIIGLLAVRLVWGVVGSAHARFTDFVHHPLTVFAYLRDAMRFRARRYIGHNPAGGAMVIALLVMISTICATGFMMTTDAFWGVRWVREAHELAVNLTIVLIGLHLAGVFFASVEHRENLVKAMVTGRKRR